MDKNVGLLEASGGPGLNQIMTNVRFLGASIVWNGLLKKLCHKLIVVKNVVVDIMKLSLNYGELMVYTKRRNHF